MEIIARVCDFDITQTELDFEIQKLVNSHPEVEVKSLRKQALEQLIDRYLLVYEAHCCGLDITEEEYEQGVMQLLEELETPENSVLFNRADRGSQIERIVSSDILIGKYLDQLCQETTPTSDDILYQFYLEKQDFFNREAEVRASHILVRGPELAAKHKIAAIHHKIHSPEDFYNVCDCQSECPSGTHCGDLGFFPRGRLVPEIDAVAFSLRINEVSQPFQTRYGWHILMVTDKRDRQTIPFDYIKDSLRESLCHLQQEMLLVRKINAIREQYQNKIAIF